MQHLSDPQALDNLSRILNYAYAATGFVVIVIALIIYFVNNSISNIKDAQQAAFRQQAMRETAAAQAIANEAHAKALTAEARIKDADAQIAESNKKIAEANAQAESARESAAQAVTGQKDLEARAEEARLRQRQIEVTLSAAETEQARLRNANLQLESRVEQERAERLKIVERLAFRTLSREARAKLEPAMRSLAGRKVMVMSEASPESQSYAADLSTALKEAGITSETSMGFFAAPGAPPGLTLKIGANRDVDGNVLAHALAAAGLVSLPMGAQRDEQDADNLTLVVGRKP